VLVSFIVVAYNAGNRLPDLIKDLEKQEYTHGKIEVILVDSNSTDNTKAVMDSFATANNDFLRICVLDNPKRTLPCGWNIALREARGDIILRVDAHVSIPADFIQNNVTCIKSGEKICGGKVNSIIDSNNSWQKTLLLAENSSFGGGIASFRRSNERRYVNTIAFAAYSREVFKKVGGYDERLARTEDNEIHYRMKKAGYKFFMDPKIHSSRYTRNTLSKMLKQKFGNGYWIGLTMGTSPRCFSLYHFAPLVFVLSIIITSLLVIFGFPQLAVLMWVTYWIAAIMMTIFSIRKDKFIMSSLMLPILFFILHISYGCGTLIGLSRMPFMKELKEECQEKERVKEYLAAHISIEP
jgi:glycosyltransferase involved in cell wall biosynthesis